MHAQLAKLEPLIEGYRAKLANVEAEPIPEGKGAGLTYADLAEKLKTQGLEETEASIANKTGSWGVPAIFFMACLAAAEVEGLSLD